jgi:hypothetical protein
MTDSLLLARYGSMSPFLLLTFKEALNARRFYDMETFECSVMEQL